MPLAASAPIKAELWVIKAKNGFWTDDRGGNLFTSRRMAEETLANWLPHRPIDLAGAEVQMCDLDDDIGQMGNLYHEFCNMEKLPL